jgi:integrase
MARERKGTLVWRASGWCARVTVTIDGEPVKKWYPLGTDNKAAAKRKLARLTAKLAAEGPPDPSESTRQDTVKEYAEDWLSSRELRGIGMVRDERINLTRHVYPEIGNLPIDKVQPSHIRSILDAVAAKGLSRTTVGHIRALLHRLFKPAWVDRLIAENPVARVDVPTMKELRKARCILTDEEVGRYIESPKARDIEVKLMGVVARIEGGMRTSDLHRWDWSMLDRVHFAQCTILRSKTGDTQEIELAPVVGAALKLKWEHMGRPEAGPVFPARRGARAGQQKAMRGNSYAKRLRRDLLRAGVIRHVCTRAANAEPLKRDEKCCPAYDRDPLFAETATTLPVDFHSFRRAFASAMADAGVNAQHAKKLAHHSDDKVHQRYVMNTAAMRRIPEAVVPKISLRMLTQKTPAVSDASGGDAETPRISAPPRRLERPTNGLGRQRVKYARVPRSAKNATKQATPGPGASGPRSPNVPAEPPECGSGTKGGTKAEPSSEAELRAALRAAEAAGNWDRVAELAARLKALATPLQVVHRGGR